MILMYSSILLVVNVLLMFFFFLKIRRQFSFEEYERLLQERMHSIILDLNLQTDQAITILEEKMEELKNLISDADGRFNALSRKLEAIDINLIAVKNMDVTLSNKKTPQKQMIQEKLEENKVVVYSGSEGFSKKDEIIRKKIVEMSKSGWANDYIAQKLSIPLAEVELILFMGSRE